MYKDYLYYRYLYNNELYHHGIKGQKWGVRRFENADGTLTELGKLRYYNNYKESDRLSNDVYNKAISKEPQITKDISDVVKRTSGELYGLDHKLKTKDSISRKIITDSKEKNISMNEASKIKDAVRYTLMSNDSDYTNNYMKFKSGLENKGYSEVRCKNYFNLYNQGKVKHKSVQSVFSTPDGYLFEVQFHTPSSQKVKNAKIPLYEEARNPRTNELRKIAIEKQMDDMAKNIPTPKNVFQIKSH